MDLTPLEQFLTGALLDQSAGKMLLGRQIFCIRMTVIEAGTGNHAKHHSERKSQVKENGRKQMIERSYQAEFPEQRSYLKFFWLKNSKTKGKVIDLEMCIHVFGGTSSPSRSNHKLRRTTADSEKQFGSFYVDDLLKTVKTVQEAVTLISNVTGMCAAGGLNLMKI